MNLICICLDTFRADIIGPDKKLSFVDTPNLDALASKSVCFDRAFGEGQPTLQIRRAFFTGRRSFPWRYNYDRRGHWHHAAGWHKIPPEQDTLAEILVAHGYMTGMVADTYHMFKPTMNYTRGFVNYDFIRGQESDNWRSGSTKSIEAQMKRHVREPIDWAANTTLTQYLWNMRDRKGEEDYLCARVFRRAAEWLEDNADEHQPFFLWVDSFDPHEPWDPPTAYADRYCPDYDGKDFIMPGAMHQRGTTPTQQEQERVKALYYGEVSFVDRWVGHLLDRIDGLKLWDDTIVVVTSDHGTEVMDHTRFGKGTGALYAFNTQIILNIAHPDITQEQHLDALVQSHDLMPTLLHLLGIEYTFCDGINFWPLVTGQAKAIRDHVVIGWAGWSSGSAAGRASVRDDTWNYVVDVDKEAQPELYHLPSDTEERNNVAEAHPDVVCRQRARLEAVLGQPLPAKMNEVCDHPAPPPLAIYNQHRYQKK